MLTLLEFLRLHPHIAAQYERFLGGEPECSGVLNPPAAKTPPTTWENGMPILKPEAPKARTSSLGKAVESVMEKNSSILSIDRHKHEMAMDATDRPSQHYVPSPPSAILSAPWPIHLDPPRPPAKGKLLSIPAAYKYLLGCKAAFDIVLVEFFFQINKGTNTAGSCWVLNREPKRNSRGYLVKKIQIHHLAKSMPAVQLAYLLIYNKECTENLYNTCGEERCINPDHHNAGKPYCAEKKFRLRKTEVPTKDKTRKDHLDAILELLRLEPEKGASILQLQSLVVNGTMTIEEFQVAMRLGEADNQLYLRRLDNRIYLKNYPSASRMAAAQRALDKAVYNESTPHC